MQCGPSGPASKCIFLDLFVFFFMEFLTIVLLCNDLYISLLLSPLGYSLLPFLFFGVRSNILTSIILVTEEQLCQGRGDHVAIASYVTPFFSKNSPQKK